MHLELLHRQFQKKCYRYLDRVSSINNIRPHSDVWKITYLSEGLISDVWQSWNSFNRDIVLFSCRGCRARDGSVICERAGDNSWMRVGYESRQISQGHNINTSNRLYAKRQEPTWGDLPKLLDIFSQLGISNSNHLINVYGSFSSPRHLQTTRNACAHLNDETINSVRRLSTFYSFTQINRPSDLAWSFATGQQIFAIEHWISEIRLIAELATETS